MHGFITGGHMRVKANCKGMESSVAPYSAAVFGGECMYISGQICTDLKTGELVKGDIKIQTKLAMENIKHLVTINGGTMADVVKCHIYLTNYKGDFNGMNGVYKTYFEEPYPARLALGVSELYDDCLVEIDAIVKIDK